MNTPFSQVDNGSREGTCENKTHISHAHELQHLRMRYSFLFPNFPPWFLRDNYTSRYSVAVSSPDEISADLTVDIAVDQASFNAEERRLDKCANCRTITLIPDTSEVYF